MDSPISPGLSCQVGEPDTGDPVLLKSDFRLKRFPFFLGHETCRDKVSGAQILPLPLGCPGAPPGCQASPP